MLRHAWMAGVAGVCLAAGVLALGVATGVGARYVSVFSSALAVASSLTGWCTPCMLPGSSPTACRALYRPIHRAGVCANKKDDLVMQRALKRFKKTLKTLDAAEVGLRSALRTMLACGTDMTQLKEEIAHATTKALGGMWKSSGTDDCPRPRRGFWPRYLAATLSPVVERACARSRPFCWLLYSYIYAHAVASTA